MDEACHAASGAHLPPARERALGEDAYRLAVGECIHGRLQRRGVAGTAANRDLPDAVHHRGDDAPAPQPVHREKAQRPAGAHERVGDHEGVEHAVVVGDDEHGDVRGRERLAAVDLQPAPSAQGHPEQHQQTV